MKRLSKYLTRRRWNFVHREQLASIARATPAAMVGYAINVGLAILAFHGLLPALPLAAWGAASLAVCTIIFILSLRSRSGRREDKNPNQSPMRNAQKVFLFSFLLALPWSVLGTAWAGTLGDSEVILIALVVGMAASGSILLSPIPMVGVIYAGTILLPLAVKCLFLRSENHLVLGALSVSYFAFLVGLIASNAKIFAERLDAIEKLKASVTALVAAREETEYAAMTDGLTGVANRRAFMARLSALSADAAQVPEYAVFYIDLDRFKSVNDAFGHATGDAVLRLAAARIEKAVRSGDLVARLGGDEFAVVALEATDRSRACALAERLVGVLCEPFFLEGQRIQIGASVGVAVASENDAGDILLKQADLAMYAGKSSGRASYCIFEADMLRSAQERQSIELGLRNAIARNELELFYQPIRRLSKDEITSFECLIRWRHPVRGLLPPDQFLSIADEMGMANEIGAWVIGQACAQAAAWPPHIAIGINLSPLQIASDDVAQRIERALQETGVAAERLEIEITESSLLQNDPVTIDQLKRLKKLGVSIALDDFGTGFSSLSYLVSFPFDRIKIDRLFVSQLGRSRESDLIVRSIAQLAKNLSCTVVAEGVETEEQLQKLRALHVSHGQGFLLGKPVPAKQAAELLAMGKNTRLARSA